MNSALPGVLHLVDSLAIGGAERVAVNIANSLPRNKYRISLCSTRREGPLSSELSPDVNRLALRRKRTFELRAISSLVHFIQQHQIRLLHAHSTSLLLAATASLFPPFPAVIWHDHYGRHHIKSRPVHQYRLLASRLAAVIAVNQSLAAWSIDTLKVKKDRVFYIPNFSYIPPITGVASNLPGRQGKRIICVANLRPQKDHTSLLQAMTLVIRQVPDVHLILVGAADQPSYFDVLKKLVVELGLSQKVTFLGQRSDIGNLLRSCDIGVLSSASEGMPLALIEYGLSKLPTIATNVGQCAEVLDHGRAGLLVPPKSPEALADALLKVLFNSESYQVFGVRLHTHVEEKYSALAVLKKISSLYDMILSSQRDIRTAHL